jgi:thiamine-monophosphate kinase
LPTRTVADLGERALIERITARLATSASRPSHLAQAAPRWLVVGPGDDAAVVEPERGALDVLTTDVQVEGVHFDCRFVPPDAIGHRALAVNLSDLAAMGARPRAALLSLVLPAALDVSVFDGLVDGLLALASAHRVSVVGGNISRSPGPLVIDVTAVGSVRRRQILTRSGARPGDAVYLTGAIGDALVGLESLRDGYPDAVDAQRQRYLRPEPRVRAGLALAGHRAASACMDLSDGLADAARQVAAASGVGIELDAGALPIAETVRSWHERRGRDPIAAALQGGDDYELLFTSRPARHGRLRGAERAFRGLAVTRIGVVTRERRLLLRTSTGVRELPEGFEHFR